MENSRDISMLRPDVSTNCRIFLQLMELAGYDAIVTGTVRDNEYQKWCFDNGYSNAQTPSFHSVKARLAFDICKNKKGEEYSDEGFWRTAGAIGKLIGFTWGGEWTSITDKPHFQWDNHGQFTGAMVRNDLFPPKMKEFMGDLSMTTEQIRTSLTAVAGTGNSPSIWAKTAVEAFIDAKLLNGDGQGNYGCQQCITREGVVQLLYTLLDRLDLLGKLK